MKTFKQFTNEAKAVPGTISSLAGFENRLDREKDPKKAEKLEKNILNLYIKIAKSQKLIDAFEDYYGMTFEYDEPG